MFIFKLPSLELVGVEFTLVEFIEFVLIENAPSGTLWSILYSKESNEIVSSSSSLLLEDFLFLFFTIKQSSLIRLNTNFS